ncbi:MAG: alpha/beta hydrolase [Casimicrobiaceae bacterium]
MRLDPELAAYLDRIARELPLPVPFDIPARRERMEAIQRRFPPPADSVAREDRVITLPGRELRVRIYRPAAGTPPAIVYFHGGGWVAGSVFTHDGACAALAQDAQAVVASVDYRLAPESPFPQPNDDAFAALEWVAANAHSLGADASRLAVGGDSAGAHLAAGLAQEARDRGIPLAFQLLIYPVIEPDFETSSYREHAVSATLTRADMIDYWGHYLGGALDTPDPRAVPSRAVTLAGLPPAHVVVAELDPLRDDGVRYAELLRAAGVATKLVEAPRLAHGFLRAAPYSVAARAAQAALGIAAGRALGTIE